MQSLNSLMSVATLSVPIKSEGSDDVSYFNSLVAEITKQFQEVNNENVLLKERLLNLQRAEGRVTRVTNVSFGTITSSEFSVGGYAEDDEVEGRPSTWEGSNPVGRTLHFSESGIDDSPEFFPEWPLNLQMRGRSAEFARDSNWRSLRQPLQVPLQLWDEFTANFAPDPCLLSPNSYLRLTWDFLCCAVLVMQLWLTPFTLAFTPNAGAPTYLSHIDDCMTLFFLLDMILNFNTGIIRQVDDYDWVVMNRRAIAKDYFSFFFWVDLVSTIPFDRLVQNGQSHLFSMVRIMRIARWLKLLRFLRLTRLLKMIRSISKSFELEIERLKKKLFFPLVALAITAVLAHMNACILQALSPKEVFLDNMYEIYCQRVSHVLLALIAGRYLDTYTEHLWILQISMAMERLAMLAVAGFSLVYQAMLLLEQSVRTELIKKDVLLYMEQHKVSHKTQVNVLNFLNEASRLASVKRSYENWIASGIPVELERMICRELWLPRLKTLGLIDYVINLKSELMDELALIVREEALARNNVLFKEGALPLAAYLVLKGVVCATSSLSDTPLPLFTAGMWVGEKALVSPDMVRTVTCVCESTCMLMAVPAKSFRDLLTGHGLLGHFEDYCVRNLWRGICGRCGVVGDHFAHECPLLWSASQPRMYTALDGEEHYLQDSDDDSGGRSPSERTEAPVPRERLTKPDLKEFLRCKNLRYLLPNLEICGVWSLSDLQDIGPEILSKIISDVTDERADVDEEELRDELSFESIEKFKESLEDHAKKVLGTSELRSQHLIFLSHHKKDCGTEAALLRQELEVEIADDLHLRTMEARVFLDTEDLDSLDTLTEHVANTHNIVLLLSKDVLTRPWVLVELVTAQRVDLPVVPVEIQKPGRKFKYPDEKFYSKLTAGRVLPPSGEAILQSCGISLKDAERSIRRVFNTISLTYSPHRPALHRKLEVADILKHCDYHPPQRDRRRTISIALGRVCFEDGT